MAPPKERPLVKNGQIIIALGYFNTFAALKGDHPTMDSKNDQITASNNSLKFK